MDEMNICTKCHVAVRPSDYYCYNCGANLHPKPPSVSTESQVMLYLGSFFLPPMGIFWGLPYIRQADTKAKIVGYIACALTVVSILIAVQTTMSIFNTVNKQVNEIQNLQGF